MLPARSARARTGQLPVFPLLFTVTPSTPARGQQLPSFVQLVGFLGPMLGIAFGFNAINVERSDGTLPRLLAQPIHRDDVINGKFVAGLAVIALILAAVIGCWLGRHHPARHGARRRDRHAADAWYW